MPRKRNPERRGPQSSRAGDVMCADGYYRMSHRANETLVCAWCSGTIEPGELLTKRESARPLAIVFYPNAGDAAIKYDNRRYPVCRGCAPFELPNGQEDV